MKIVYMIIGIVMLTASAWIGPALSNALGVSEVFGYISISSTMAFFGGCLFMAGLFDRRYDFWKE